MLSGFFYFFVYTNRVFQCYMCMYPSSVEFSLLHTSQGWDTGVYAANSVVSL